MYICTYSTCVHIQHHMLYVHTVHVVVFNITCCNMVLMCVYVQYIFDITCRNMVLVCTYSETSLIQHSMGHENNVGLGDCWIMECLLPYLCMVTVPHIMVGLERMLDYRGVRLARFHCKYIRIQHRMLQHSFHVCTYVQYIFFNNTC